MIVRKTGMIILALMLSIAGLAQDEGDQWHLENYSSETPGINLEKVYEDFVTGRTPQKKVIVAVIDSGIDIEHEDLKDVIWVNEDEIPGNGIDDDRNGYIDDVNGWNFIGNANGDMVDKDNLEVTRLYAKYHARFGDKKPSASEMDDWKFYQKLKNEFEEKKADAIAGKERYLEIKNFYESSKAAVIEKLGTEDFSLEDIQNIEADTEELQRSQGFLIALDQQGFTEEALVEWGDYVKGQADWYYNPDVDVRATIIKDDINNPYEKGYGNNIVKGPDPSHGTHVAGIIAASRDNGLGGDGIANHVLIMPVRTVPGGDEHDKDVANAILYAVDNGARVINMSFGKSYSPQEKIVAEAIQYAEDKGVLLVHAAGNDSKDVDATNNYPTNFSQYIKGKVKTYLTIGASNHDGGEELPASFTNYGGDKVDLFAPGVDIYASLPEDTYGPNSGTSMAAPVVSGIAALIMSYYPDLSAKKVKKILEKTTRSLENKMVQLPGSGGIDENGNPQDPKLVAFGSLSRTGGLVDAYAAMKLAQKKSKVGRKMMKVSN